MTVSLPAEEFLADCTVDPAVFALREDYRAQLLVVDGLTPESADPHVNEIATELVAAAESHARALVGDSSVEELAHIAAWREAYRAFGAKPQRTRNSLEALTRRAGDGLPRVNALTDIYNAVSVLHQVPLGGEDRALYAGPARLVRATGQEDFETVSSGETIVDHPKAGEVIWRDDRGVTCRRWNWRQGPRTALTADTTRVLFILDALAPMNDRALSAAARALTESVSEFGPDVTVAERTINPS